MKVTFTRAEKDFIKEAAEHRTLANKNSHDIAAYNPAYMKFNAASSDLISIASEAAVVKAFGYDLTDVKLEVWPVFYLPGHKKLYDGADLNHNGTAFEVRRVNRIDSDLVIRRKDLIPGQANIKVFIAHEVDSSKRITWMDDDALIVGWIDSLEGWEIGSIPNYNGYPETNARVVNDSQLNTNFEEALERV